MIRTAALLQLSFGSTWRLVGLLALVACSAEGAPAASAATSTGAGGAGGTTLATGGGEPCGPPCSGDLLSVLDCAGNAIATCSNDTACKDGVCIDDPCQASAAARSSYGCEFWAVRTNGLEGEAEGGCHAVFLANTWTVPAHFTVEYQGAPLDPAFVRRPVGQGVDLVYEPYDPDQGLAPGEVALLSLSEKGKADPKNPFAPPPCPAPPVLTADADVLQTGFGEGFRIRADRPVAAYQVTPFGGGSAAQTSATLLLPTTVWTTDYIAVNPYPQGYPQEAGTYDEPGPTLNVLAMKDTTITLTPRVQLVGGNGVPASPAHQPLTIGLKAGQHLQLAQLAELTGSSIAADAPVAVFGAAPCFNVPITEVACDSAQQQLPPLTAWGHEYAAVMNPPRDAHPEAPPWRIVAAADGTELSFEPPQPGVKTTLGRGELLEWQSRGPFVVRSQDSDHSFYLGAYMTGAGIQSGGQGDPEWVNVVPPAQFLESYTFFTDPTYPETHLVVVRAREGGAAADVTLDCAGVLEGWTAFGDYEYVYVDLVHGDFQNVGACSNGVRSMKSARPFGVTVWGWGSEKTALYSQYVSYAYPGGAALRAINAIEIPK